MGKGDKKTRRGKLFMGSYGNTRPKKKSDKVEQVVVVAEKPKSKGKK
jgi:30S ribosomal protein S31